MGLDQSDKGGFIGAGRPGGPGGNVVKGSAPDDPTRKARPGAQQSTKTVGSQNDATRKARPKSSGSGQSTNTGRGK